VLKRLSDSHVFAPAQIDQIVENLAALEKLGAGVTRYGASLPSTSTRDNSATQRLPRYVARIREGNKESHEFLIDDTPARGSALSHGLVALTVAEPSRGLERAVVPAVADSGRAPPQKRVTSHDIYVSTEMAKLLRAIAVHPASTSRVSAHETALFHVIQEEPWPDDRNQASSSAARFGNRPRRSAPTAEGPSIQRYKGLGEMNPEAALRNDDGSRETPPLKVDIADAAKADALFTLLMGDEVPPAASSSRTTRSTCSISTCEHLPNRLNSEARKP
jgi:DNA gyrase subunit B